MVITHILIVGIVLCALGILMLFGQPSFLLARYEGFHKAIRKNMKSANRESLAKFYSLLFLATGMPLTIGGIIGLIVAETYEIFSLWLYVVVGVIGISGLIYMNVSKKFIEYE